MSLSNPSIGFAEEEYEPYTGPLYPEILQHPNIPKPLHHVNPRSIMGQEKWDIVRKKAYESTNQHCIACGVHKSKAKGPKWLEAHEFYTIDYEAGRVEIEKIIPLCHYCHNFIHSGRLYMILNEEKLAHEVRDILEHGFKILSENELDAFPFTVHLAHELGANTYGVEPAVVPHGEVPAWENWRLIWEGKEYPPKYKSEQEWREAFSK